MSKAFMIIVFSLLILKAKAVYAGHIHGNQSDIPVCSLVERSTGAIDHKEYKLHIADFYITTSAKNDCELVRKAWAGPELIGSPAIQYCKCTDALGKTVN